MGGAIRPGVCSSAVLILHVLGLGFSGLIVTKASADLYTFMVEDGVVVEEGTGRASEGGCMGLGPAATHGRRHQIWWLHSTCFRLEVRCWVVGWRVGAPLQPRRCTHAPGTECGNSAATGEGAPYMITSHDSTWHCRLSRKTLSPVFFGCTH